MENKSKEVANMAKKKKGFKKTSMTQDELDLLKYRESFQQWMPIKDVQNGFIIDENDDKFPVIELGTANLELMTMDEKAMLGKRLEQAIASFPFQEFQLLIVPMPFDIEDWQAQVTERLRELSAQRDELTSLVARERRQETPNLKRINELNAQLNAISFYENHLAGQNRFVMGRIQSGQVVAQKAFFIPKFKPLGNLTAYQKMAEAVAHKMEDVAINSHLCDNQEIRNLLFVILNPLRKDLHKVEPRQMSPLMRTNTAK